MRAILKELAVPFRQPSWDVQT